MTANRSIITLKKLQQLKLIPKLQPIRLATNQLFYLANSPSKPMEAKERILMISHSQTISYCVMSMLGRPEDQDGIIIFPDGAFYKGAVCKGAICGQGKLINEESMYEYDGEWNLGVPDGKGTENICGNVYDGHFRDGKKQGKGVLRYADGTVFEGTFKENQINGYGKKTFKNYEWKGFWRNGYLDGEGTQTIKDKNCGMIASHILDKGKDSKSSKINKCKESVYTGWFSRGEREGFGKFRWDQHRQYEGNFKHGQLHGEGVLRIGNKVFRGVWEQGNDLQMKEVNRGGSNSKIQFKRV